MCVYTIYYDHDSENNFAIRFLLEIPLRGFSFQMNCSKEYRVPKNSTNNMFQRISFEEEISSWGSQAENMVTTGGEQKLSGDISMIIISITSIRITTHYYR